MRTGASNRIAHLLHRFSTIQQAQSFAGGDPAAYRIELAVEA